MLNDKVIIVIGGGGLIGKEKSRTFVKRMELLLIVIYCMKLIGTKERII